ncbi:MAG: hypothetical protein WBR17_28120, partial [Paraburkholderia sp.]|uniref:hypothetical protein n=1 Tax=Paraburkholderia sp. TaxID=1926495 RepID=UPI003C67974F
MLSRFLRRPSWKSGVRDRAKQRAACERRQYTARHQLAPEHKHDDLQSLKSFQIGILEPEIVELRALRYFVEVV